MKRTTYLRWDASGICWSCCADCMEPISKIDDEWWRHKFVDAIHDHVARPYAIIDEEPY